MSIILVPRSAIDFLPRAPLSNEHTSTRTERFRKTTNTNQPTTEPQQASQEKKERACENSQLLLNFTAHGIQYTPTQPQKGTHWHTPSTRDTLLLCALRTGPLSGDTMTCHDKRAQRQQYTLQISYCAVTWHDTRLRGVRREQRNLIYWQLHLLVYEEVLLTLS